MKKVLVVALISIFMGTGVLVLKAVAQVPAAPVAAGAQEPAARSPIENSFADLTVKASDLKIAADTVWVLLTAMLVFFMNLGFACVESGFCRAKNCVNILSKNFIVFAATSIGFLVLGWGVMFGDGNPFFGTTGLFMVGGADNSPALWNADSSLNKYVGVYSSIGWTTVPLWAKFFFQLVFAGTAATIVSGCVAERIKYYSFIVFSFIMAVLIYPVVGHWIWGGGWAAARGFLDFAGSTQVHSIGGWAGLAGILVLGPRMGKYGSDGKVHPILGHNMTSATLGTFVLWFGWFGFNPGSTMAADPMAIARVCVTTNTAAAAATLSATMTSWFMLGKPDLGMTLNGCLAGLVAITAPCAFVSVPSSLLIGLISGVLVVVAVLWFDKMKIDDPVGALSVHLVNGIWGTLAVGLFCVAEWTPTKQNGLFIDGSSGQLINQILGALGTAAYVLVISLAAWGVLKATMGIRVSAQEELEGLDYGEHGNEAYSGFVLEREV